MKKFLALLFFLALLIIGGLSFFVVHSFNADAFQQQVVKGISGLTERDFVISGDTHVSWFPSPQVVMNDVTLSNLEKSMSRNMIQAKRIAVQFDLVSFFKEPLVINRIEIEDPKIYMERLNASETNWNFPFLFKDINDNLDRELLVSDINQTRVNALTIKNGTLEYENHLTKTGWIISDINGNITLDSLQGPYNFSGTLTAFGKTVATQLHLDRLQDDSPVGFKINLNASDNSFSFDDVNGTVMVGVQSQPKLTADGAFNISRPNDFLALMHINPLDASLNVPSMGSFGYESNYAKTALNNFVIRFGNREDSAAVSGSVSREEKNGRLFYTASLAVNKLDYTQWKNILSDLKWEYLTDEKQPDVALKLNIKDFIWDGKTIQNFSADFLRKNNRFIVENGKALLPGNTETTFSGGTLTQNNETGLDLLIVASSPSVRDLLKDYADISFVPNSLLKNAKFNGRIMIYPNRFTTDIQSLDVDKSKIAGHLAYRKTDKLPEINSQLNIDSIDFDAYTGYHAPDKPIEADLFVSLIKDALKDAFFVKRFHGAFDLTLKNVRYRALPFEEAVLKGNVSENNLKIDSFEIKQMANADITGSGDFTGAGTDIVNINGMKLNFKTAALNLFLGKAFLKTDNAFMKNVKAFEMNLDVAEAEKMWTVALQSKIADMEFSLDGKISTDGETRKYQDMKVFIAYPSFYRFVTNVWGLNTVNSSLTGYMKFNITLNGTDKDLTFNNGGLQIGPNKLDIDGSYKAEENGLFVLNVSAPSFDVNKYIWNELKNISWTGMDSQKPFQLEKLDRLNQQITVKTGQLLYDGFEIKNAVLEALISNQTVTLKNLSGTVGTENVPVHLDGSFSWQKEPEATLNYSVENLPLNENVITLKNMSVGGGTLSSSGNLTAQGKSPGDMLAHLNGKGTYSLKNILWTGTNIEKIEPLIDRAIQNRVPQNVFDKQMQRLLSSGKTMIEDISGHYTVDNGRFQAMASALKGKGFLSDPMQIEWGVADESLNVSIPLSLTKYPDYPPFALTLKGKLNQLDYETNYVDLSASVADVIRVNNEQIEQREQEAQEEKAIQNRNEREEKVRQAVFEARAAVRAASDKVKSGDNSRALQLFQSAQDAVEFMNNLSIKESLTDAEYIQLTEQSRLAILKAEEAVSEATNDKFFEDRKFIRALEKQAEGMHREIKRIGQENPDYEIVQKFIPVTGEYAKEISDISNSLSANETEEEHLTHMNRVKEVYLKILKGYQYVLRFDPSAVPITPLLISMNDTPASSAARVMSAKEEGQKETLEQGKQASIPEKAAAESIENTQTPGENEMPDLEKADEIKSDEAASGNTAEQEETAGLPEPALQKTAETPLLPEEDLSQSIRTQISGQISRSGEDSSENAVDETELYSENGNKQGETGTELDEEMMNETAATGMRGQISRSD